MKRVLISGGFGFLGTTLIETLIKRYGNAIKIHVVDNLTTNPISYEMFLEEISHPDFLTYDIAPIHEFCQSTKDTEWDVIYHLASVVGPAGVLEYGGRIAFLINRDAYVVSQFAIETGAKLVDISTSEIYGGGQEGLCKEDYPRIISANYSSRLEYATGKLASEVALCNMTKVSDLDATIIRPFNIAGPRQSGRGGFVLPRFIGQAMLGHPLTVFGDGSQIRAFTHVEDMANGIILGAEKGGNGVAYNLGNISNKVTILEMAEAVRELVNVKAEINFVDPKELYGPLYREANDKFPDATLAQQDLGWECELSCEAVINDAAEYMSKLDTTSLKELSGVS